MCYCHPHHVVVRQPVYVTLSDALQEYIEIQDVMGEKVHGHLKAVLEGDLGKDLGWMRSTSNVNVFVKKLDNGITIEIDVSKSYIRVKRHAQVIVNEQDTAQGRKRVADLLADQSLFMPEIFKPVGHARERALIQSGRQLTGNISVTPIPNETGKLVGRIEVSYRR